MTISPAVSAAPGSVPEAVGLAVALKAHQIARSQGAQMLQLLEAAAETIERAGEVAAEPGLGEQIDTSA